MKSRIALVLFLLLMFETSSANVWENRWGGGGATMLYKMWGGVKDRSSLSYNMSFEARYGVLPYLQIGADFGYGSFKPSMLGTSTVAEMGAPFRTFVMPLNITFKATPLHKHIHKIKPYALLGAGFLFWELRNVEGMDGNIFSKSGFKWGDRISRETNLGMAYGVGFEWFIIDRFSVDLQARNTHYLGKMLDNVGYNDANDRLGEFKVSALYYFGGERDKDKDGIPDEIDVDPLKAEDFDGFQDTDGAPDPDNDNDGILDVDDDAPNEPEDMDGFQDSDGAPDLDNDNDGVLDVNDKAPLVPEDLDNFQDDDGIPDLDNDQDGILDKDDDCPNQAETVNGVDDEDGCPDQDQAFDIFQRKEIALVQATFETGSAELKPGSVGYLDELAQKMLNFPTIIIEIRGHTDNVGDAFSNQVLSEKRANRVREYIIGKGVGPNRIVAVGFGERYPIDANLSADGRAKNRRIEMVRVR